MKFLHKFFFSYRCVYGGKSHKFEARYSEKPLGITKASGSHTTAESLRKLFVRAEYVRDVYIWCGKVVDNG